jgi:hypothetical protein
MRKSVLQMGLLVAVFVLLLCLPAIALDVGKAVFGAEEGSVVLDGYITGGKQFEADYTINNKIDTLTISSGENQWYMEGEAGIKLYDIVRPFVRLSTLTGVYANREFGLDIYWPLAGLDVGIRGSCISDEQYKMSKNKFGYVGAILKF